MTRPPEFSTSDRNNGSKRRLVIDSTLLIAAITALSAFFRLQGTVQILTDHNASLLRRVEILEQRVDNIRDRQR